MSLSKHESSDMLVKKSVPTFLLCHVFGEEGKEMGDATEFTRSLPGGGG